MIDKITVLGQDYAIEYHTVKNDSKLQNFDGYCAVYEKKIVMDKQVIDQSTDKYPEISGVALDFYTKQVFRHEILHAFFEESGINYRYSKDEEDFLVDWIAKQFPKLLEVYEQLGVAK